MPKPFQFKLQRVLDYRIQLEDRARHALAVARRDQQEQVLLIERFKEELGRHLKSMSEKTELSSAELWL